MYSFTNPAHAGHRDMRLTQILKYHRMQLIREVIRLDSFNGKKWTEAEVEN